MTLIDIDDIKDNTENFVSFPLIHWDEIETYARNQKVKLEPVRSAPIVLLEYDDNSAKCCCGNCNIVIENPRYNYCPYCGVRFDL